jgi:hypothetical protein
MAVKYTLAKLREVVSLNLGFGRVALELDNGHFDRSVESALNALARGYPMHGHAVVNVQAGGLKYLLPVSNCIGVLDVSFHTTGSRFEEAPYYVRYIDRMLELGDMVDTQKIFGDDPIWHWQMEVNQSTGDEEVWIYTSFTRSTFIDTYARLPNVMAVKFAWTIEASDDVNVGVNRIPRDFRQWVEDYATAKARMTMGDIRGKFRGVPGAEDASLLPNDGASHVERAEAAIEKLEADLQARRRQTPILVD